MLRNYLSLQSQMLIWIIGLTGTNLPVFAGTSHGSQMASITINASSTAFEDCPGTEVILTGINVDTDCGNYDLEWSSLDDPDLEFIRNQNGLQPKVTLQNKVSTYKLVVTETCTGTKDSVEIVFTPSLIAAPGTDADFCVFTTDTLGTAAQPGVTYAWSPATGLDNTTVARPEISYTGQYEVTYTLSVDNGNGCQVDEDITVRFHDLPQANFTADTACLGTGTHFQNTTLDTNIVAYNWSFGVSGSSSTQENPTFTYPTAAAFTASLTVESVYGCTNTISKIVEVPAQPVINGYLANDPFDCNSNDGRISMTASAPYIVGSIQYSIDGGNTWSNSSIFNSLSEGNYQIQVRNGGVCVENGDAVNLQDPPQPQVDEVVSLDPTDCDANNGSIQVTASGGTGDYHYSINGVEWRSNPYFGNLGSGSYPVLVRNANGTCRVNDGLTILSEPNSPIITFVNAQDPRDCGSTDGSITINTAGGNGQLEYSINGGNSWFTNNKFEQLAQGVFEVRVRNGDGTCEVTGGAVSLEDPQVPQLVEIISTNPSDCAGTDGKIEVDALAGSSPIQYSLNDGLTWSFENVFLDLSAGNYDLKLRNSDGSCAVDAGTATLSDPPTPTINTLQFTDPSDCGLIDGTITVEAANGTGNYHYSIDDGTTWQNQGYFENLPGGTYAIQVRNADESCATGDQSVSLTDPVPPVNQGFSALDPTTCSDADGKIEMQATGNIGIEYSIDGGNTWASHGVFNNLQGGNFDLYIRNADTTCATSLGQIDLVAPSGIVLDQVYSESVSDCGQKDGAIVVNATYGGNSELEYSIDNGQTWQDTNRFEQLDGGIYAINIRTLDGTCALNIPVTRVLEPTRPQIDEVLTADPSDCNKEDGHVFIIEDNNQLFETSIDGGQTYTMQKHYMDLAAGEYWVKVRNTDATCETDLGIKVLQEPTAPEILNVNKVEPSACMAADGSIKIDLANASNIHTSIDGGLSWQNQIEFTDLPSGNYHIRVRNDDRTCEVAGPSLALKGGTSTLEVTVNTEEADCGLANGGIFITITGQTSVVDYSIDGGETWQEPNSFPNLTAGDYHVMARENYDCITDAGVAVVEEDGAPEITSFQKTDPSHCLSPDGFIEIEASGDLGPIEYSVNGGLSWQAANVFNGLSNGAYQLMARYQNGSCTVEGPIASLDAPGAPVILDIQTTEPFCENEDGTLFIQATPSTNTTLEYSIDNGQTWQDQGLFENLSAGNYPVVVRNSNLSCPTQAGTIQLESGSMPTISNLYYENPDCFDNDGMIEVQLAQSLPGITQFSRNNGLSWQNSPVFEDLTPGTFHILVRNMSAGEWCGVDAGPMDLVRPSAPVVSVSMSNPTDCDLQNGRITVNANGQFDLEYSLDGNNWQTSPVFEDLDGGTYVATVRYTDGNCETTTIPVTLTTPERPEIDRVFSQNPDCDGFGGMIDIQTNGGTGTLEYSIDGGNIWYQDSIFVDVAPGTYQVKVRNNNGSCEITGSTITIEQKQRPVVTEIYPTIPDCDNSNGQLEIQASISDAPLSVLQYSIDGGITWQNNRVFNNLDAGIYHIMVQRLDALCMLDHGNYRLQAPDQPEIILIENVDPTDCSQENGRIEILALGANGQPNAQLEYSIDGGATWADNPQFLNLGGGLYQPRVRFTDGSCMVTDSDIVLETPAQPERTLLSLSNPDCDRMNGNINLEAQGNPNQSMEYSIDGGLSWTNNGAFFGLMPGDYEVYYRYEDGSCQTYDTTITLSYQDIPQYISAAAADPSACDAADGQVEITATGIQTLSYSLDGINWQLSPVFDNLDAGTYTTYIQYADGRCQSTGEVVELNLENEIQLNDIQSTALSDCNTTDGIISIVATGDDVLEYSLNGNNWQDNPVFENLAGGTYTPQVRFKNLECTVNASPVVIEAQDPISFDQVQMEHISDCGSEDGMVQIDVNANTSVEYSLNGGQSWQSNSIFENLQAGDYMVMIRKGDGSCVQEYPANPLVISSPESPTIQNLSKDDPTCYRSDGIIEVNAVANANPNGLTLEYSIDGDSWQINNIFQNLGKGDYFVQTRLAGTSCSTSETISLREPGGCPTCEEVFTASNLNMEEVNMTNPVCIPIALNDLADYDLLLDGVSVSPKGGCDVDSLHFYNYVPLVTLGALNGPFTLNNWNFNGNTYNGSFPNLDALVDSMNVWDATGNWQNDPDSYTLVGGSNTFSYGVLTLTQQSSGRSVNLNSDKVAYFKGTLIEIPGNGTKQLVAFKKNDVCTDTLEIFINPAPNAAVFTVNQRIYQNKAWTLCDLESVLSYSPNAVSLCGSPAFGQATINNNNCIEYTPGTDYYGADDFCVETCYQMGNQTICDTVEINILVQPEKNTLYLSTEINTALDTCLESTIMPMTNGNVSGSICNNGDAVVTIDGNDATCLNINPTQNFDGLTEICVVHCIPQPAPWGTLCDTTTITLLVADPCPEPIFAADTLYGSSINGFGTVCLPIPLFDINSYQLSIDGIPYASDFADCDIDTIVSYSYFSIPSGSRNGPFLIDNWTVNGTNFSGQANSLQEIVDLLNIWDPTGDWELYPRLLSIIGGSTNNVYDDLVITPTDINVTINVSPDKGEFSRGTEVAINGDGLHYLTATHRTQGCADMVMVVINGSPLPQKDTLEVSILENNSISQECIPINELNGSVQSFDLCGGPNNGIVQLTGSNCFDYTPDMDFYGEDEFCVIICDQFGVCDTTIVHITVEEDMDCTTIFPTTDMMIETNFCDGTGTVCLPIPPTEIADYQLYVDGNLYNGNTGACNFDTSFLYNLALLPGAGADGPYNVDTWTIDGIDFNGSFDNLQDLLGLLNNWDNQGNWSLDTQTGIISGGQAGTDYGDLTITQSGSNITISISPQIQRNPLGTTIDLNVGDFTIIAFNTRNGCRDTLELEIACPLIPDLNNQLSLGVGGTMTVCLGDQSINFDENYIASIVNNCPGNSNAQFSLDMMNNCVTISGIMQGTAEACYEICLQNGDCFLWNISATVTAPCQSFIADDNITLAADCNNSMIDLCIEGFTVPAVSANFSLEVDGEMYGDPLQPCSLDSTFSFSYFSLPGQGGAGPYRIISWRINNDIFSGEFDDIPGLIDSMNTWDPTGSWMLNTSGLSIIGGDPDNSYGRMEVVQISTNSPATLVANTTIIPRGIRISVERKGNYELVFTQNLTGCRDTVLVETSCVSTEIVMDTMTVGQTGTFCIGTFELPGNFQQLSNSCEDASGEFVVFDWSPQDTCITYEAMEPGTEQACFVLCDDLGICDTTIVMVTVEANNNIDTTEVIARGDTFEVKRNLPSVLNILGNDRYGTITSARIIQNPRHGEAMFLQDGTVQYVPDEDYCDEELPDNFLYTICTENGCDSAEVFVTVICAGVKVMNGFSPNDDGYNDFFVIDGALIFPENTLRVYNRWGNQVFYKRGYRNSWTGDWDGESLPDGTYYYVFEDGEGNTYSGYVQIQR
jgi:gliding motility-associated-like protein